MEPDCSAPPGVIDAHVHILPGWRLAGLMRWIHRAFPDHPVPADIGPDGILDDLRAHNTRFFFNLVYPLRPRETGRLNQFNFDVTQRLPQCAGWGSLHPETPDKPGVARRCLDDFGFLGMKFHPFVQRFDITDPAMDPVYEILAARKRPLFLHTGFDAFYGLDMPPEQVATLAQRHPDMPIILSHMLFPRLRQALDLMQAYPQLMGDLTNVPGCLCWMAREQGRAVESLPETALLRRVLPGFSGRLLFGTDHPAGMGAYPGIYADLHALGLPADTVRAATWDTPLALVRRHCPGRWPGAA